VPSEGKSHADTWWKSLQVKETARAEPWGRVPSMCKEQQGGQGGYGVMNKRQEVKWEET
jgi:hypothetical protein